MAQSSKPKSRRQRVVQHHESHHETHHHVHEAPKPEKTEQHVYHHRERSDEPKRKSIITEKIHPRGKSEAVILMCAVIVFSIWGFRSLYEYKSVAVRAQEKSKGLNNNFNVKELVGLSPNAPHPYQFLVGFGFVFFVLSVGATFAPKLAASFAVLVAVGSTLANGSSIFKFVNNTVSRTTAIGQETKQKQTMNHPSQTEHKENQRPATHGA